MIKAVTIFILGWTLGCLIHMAHVTCAIGVQEAIQQVLVNGKNGTSAFIRLKPSIPVKDRIQHAAEWSVLYYKEFLGNYNGAWSSVPFLVCLAFLLGAAPWSFSSLVRFFLVVAAFPFIYDFCIPGFLPYHRHVMPRIVAVTWVMAVAVVYMKPRLSH